VDNTYPNFVSANHKFVSINHKVDSSYPNFVSANHKVVSANHNFVSANHKVVSANHNFVSAYPDSATPHPARRQGLALSPE
jgi:hypothetical protein